MLYSSQTVTAVTGLELTCILTLRGSPPDLTTLLSLASSQHDWG